MVPVDQKTSRATRGNEMISLLFGAMALFAPEPLEGRKPYHVQAVHRRCRGQPVC